jgi:progressive ankylosis protein
MDSPNLTSRRVFNTWWPLAASWLLMSIELPAINAVIARLANPEINLAAFGGIMYPLALIIESPIIMLLAASTALSKDWASFVKLRRFMQVAGASLTILHALVAFTPLYYVVTERLLGVPHEIVAPARLGLMLMTPWTWSIAYRRFHQGMLIRFGHSRAVSNGTLIRLLADLTVLGAGYLLKIPGTIVAGGAIAAGVVSEAVYVGLVSRPVIQLQLKPGPSVSRSLTFGTFIAFYLPLVMTSLISLLVQPIGAAALSRMPQAIESLATWSVVSGLIFMLRSFGIAYNEVVVALLDEPGSTKKLRSFTINLILVTSILWLLILATPLSSFWFQTLSALPAHLVALAQLGVWIALPLPALAVMQSWFQGAILHSHITRGITEAVVIFLLVNVLTLFIGVRYGRITGLYVGLISLMASSVIQTLWLWLRSKPALRAVHQRDALELIIPPVKPVP